MNSKTKKEYGGFLPLELNNYKRKTQYYFKRYENVLTFNTAKAAIKLIKATVNMDSILIPYYLCPNVISELKKNFTHITFYHIDHNLLPLVEVQSDTLIYIVDYFGIKDYAINRFIKKHKSTYFIVDNAHAFFNKPILRNNVFTIYSCKKFFGVPDGAYLISKIPIKQIYEKTFAAAHADYLLQSLEQGTNSCYERKKHIDDFLNENYGGISLLAEILLNTIDYRAVKRIRKKNFALYHKAFKSINKIKCESGSIPYIYPLNVGKNIKQKLVEQRIYVPTLWKQLIHHDFSSKIEYDFAENTIFLPADQSYVKKDIMYIIQIVKALIYK